MSWGHIREHGYRAVWHRPDKVDGKTLIQASPSIRVDKFANGPDQAQVNCRT